MSLVAPDTTSTALRQVNKSPELLRTTSFSSSHEIVLIFCILLVHFQATLGDRELALQHGIQAPILFASLTERVQSGEVDPAFVRLSTLGPIIKGLEIQASYVVRGDKSRTYQSLHRLLTKELPSFKRLQDLDQAHFTLHNAYLSIISVGEGFSGHLPFDVLQTAVQERKAIYGAWLERWHKCFQDLLNRSRNSLSARAWKKAKVLEIWYQHMYIFAHVDLALELPWDSFRSNFKQIVELSADVLDTYEISILATSNGGRFPWQGYGLSVSIALFCAMARCTDHELRIRAARLLLERRRTRHGFKPTSHWKGEDSVSPSEVESWLSYLSAVPQELGSAVFFGAFSKEDLEKTECSSMCPDLG